MDSTFTTAPDFDEDDIEGVSAEGARAGLSQGMVEVLEAAKARRKAAADLEDSRDTGGAR